MGIRRRWGLWSGLGVLATLVAGFPTVSGAGVRWLPGRTSHPVSLADPREPAFRILFAPDPERIDAVVGAPLPLASTASLTVSLETALFLRLGREGAIFPLQTVDGMFGLGVAGTAGEFPWRLRLLHHSAHRADGDSTVSFEGPRVSREFWQLEVARTFAAGHGYARVGSVWNALSPAAGFTMAVGGVLEREGADSPFLAVHLQAEEEGDWRVDQDVRVGWRTGDEGMLRIGFRYTRGNRRQGQYRTQAETLLGIELQFQEFRSR